MNKKHKLSIQIALLMLVLVFIINQQQLFFTSKAAYRHFERYLHFGPATELYISDNIEGRYILAEYEDWIAVFNLYQRYGLFYTPASMVGELKIDNAKEVTFRVVSYNFTDNEMHFVLWAYAKEPVTTLEVQRSDGSTFLLESFTDHLHFGHWPSENQTSAGIRPSLLRGYDAGGELVYEKEID
jgi:hypothetical protein